MKKIGLIITAIIFGLNNNILAQSTDETIYNYDFFVSINSLSTGILLLTAYIKKKIKTKDDNTILVSMVVGFLLSFIGYVMKLGIFYNVDWYYIFIYGFIAVLMANGLSTWEIIKKILTYLKLRIPEGE